MDTARRVLTVAAAAAIAVWASYEAVRYGIAGAVAGTAMRELSAPSRTDGVVPVGSWWANDLDHAASMSPKDPALHELRSLAVVRSTRDPVELKQAQGDLVAALQARPGSPYAWSNLAELKYLIGETGPVFESALVNAARLGPFEPEVQRTVVQYGLAVIDEVGPAAREAIDRMLAAGMRRNAAEMLTIASRRGRLDAACRHLDGVPRPAVSKWTHLCQSMEATS